MRYNEADDGYSHAVINWGIVKMTESSSSSGLHAAISPQPKHKMRIRGVVKGPMRDSTISVVVRPLLCLMD